MNKTKIQWTDTTWNPVHGCSHAGSPGCDHCYARRMSKRLAGRYGYPPAPDNFKVTLRPDRLEQPLKWRKPRKIFVCSMSDLFHEDVPFMFIGKVMSAAALAMQRHGHTFQFLTKRPARMLEFCHSGYLTARGWNKLPFWLGVTVENQATADERIPLLLQTPAAVRFVSAEPLLGVVDLSEYLPKPCGIHLLVHRKGQDCLNDQMKKPYGPFLDQVITGGETGPGARPMHPDWVRELRDQCLAAGTGFFFKQWGEWWPVNHDRTTGNNIGPGTQSCWLDIRGSYFPRYSAMLHDPHKMYRIGNKRTGHLLDGRAWRQIPEVTKCK